MSDCQFVPLGHILSNVKGGGTPERNVEDYWNGIIPWATVKDFRDGSHVLDSTQEFISEQGLKNSASKLIPPHIPIVCTRMAVGRIAMADFAVAINQDLKALFPKPEVDPNYLLRAIESVRPEIESTAIGSTVKGISLDQLLSVKVFFPVSEKEQKKIAEILSTLDRAIEQTEALIAKQQRIKTGLMQDLLTKGIDEHGNIRSEATHAFKDSPLGRIPVEWDAKLLDECVRSDAPICYGILMPGTGVDDGVPVIKVKDIFDGAICLDDILLTDPKIDAAYKRSRLRTNDLLITIRGTTGRVALVPSVLDGANITQDTARIRLKDGHLPVYFFYLLQSADVQAQVDLQTLGQAVKGINIAEVRKLRVLVPSEDEQNRICQLLGQVNSAWQVSVNSRDKLLLQKAGLMHDLLTGKRRVTPLLAPAATA